MIAWLLAMTIFLNPVCDACTCRGLGRAYVGGLFSNIGGAARAGLAMIDGKGLAVGGFTCDLDSECIALYLDEANGHLWVGGDFTTVNGAAQTALVVVDWNTGTAVYSPTVSGTLGGAGPEVYKFTYDEVNGHLYVGGSFTTVNGSAHTGACRFTLGATPTLDTAWSPVLVGGGARRMPVLGDVVYIAGNGFTSVNGTVRPGVGAVDRTTGTTTDAWNPRPNTGGVSDILIESASSVFFTGGFSSVDGGTARAGLAECDATVGTVTSWNPGADILTGGGSLRGLTDIDTLRFVCFGNFTASASLTGPGRVAQFFKAGSLDSSFTHSFSSICNDAHMGVDGRLYVCFGGSIDDVFAISVVNGLTYTDWTPDADNTCSCCVTSLTPP